MPVSAKKGSFSTQWCWCVLHPSPVSSMLMMMAVQVRPRRKGIFFRWQQTTPLFTPPTLKRRGKGCKGSSNQMSMGTFFRRHRYIEKRCWVYRMCVCVTCLVTHAQTRVFLVGWCARAANVFHNWWRVLKGPMGYLGAVCLYMQSKHMRFYTPRHTPMRSLLIRFWKSILT